MLEYFKTLYDYNYWANTKILDTAEQITDEQLFAPTHDSYGSLHGTLVHMMSAEWVWRTRWLGTSPKAPLRKEDFPSLAAIRSRWNEEEQQMRAFLASLSEENVRRIVQYTNMQGQAYSVPLWQLMMQLVNHGTQHRSEAAMILTELGHSPGDIDMLVFVLG
ncbi:MAG TPA: DinB family protein [Ktedonobacteraceae bacterium]|nr:DinB family protein [Ktedonobacteraceae bacterium]